VNCDETGLPILVEFPGCQLEMPGDRVFRCQSTVIVAAHTSQRISGDVDSSTFDGDRFRIVEQGRGTGINESRIDRQAITFNNVGVERDFDSDARCGDSPCADNNGSRFHGLPGSGDQSCVFDRKCTDMKAGQIFGTYAIVGQYEANEHRREYSNGPGAPGGVCSRILWRMWLDEWKTKNPEANAAGLTCSVSSAGRIQW